MRTEHDFLGEKEIHEDAFYGIHSVRACENFPDGTPFAKEWYQAIGLVKQACYIAASHYKKAVTEKHPTKAKQLNLPEDAIFEALIGSAEKISQGDYFDQFIVPAIQGGAGTSINMNINEIITNASLESLGYKKGEYGTIDPIEQANLFQSTNDVIPTALKVAILQKLNKLEEVITEMRKHVEHLENKHRNSLRIGYTQMQQAVPSTFGHLFGAYNEALSRDWWRVSKANERIKTVNLGGGAIGTGIAIPRFYILEVVTELKKLSGLPITQNDNLTEATSNQDSLVEVHAILKAHAVTLEKMVNDIRLLSSDLMQQKELEIPARQAGSSIMPGKVNPVIPEFVVSAVHKIYTNDAMITQLSAMGSLELNAYLPSIGHAFLESLRLLIACNQTLAENLFNNLKVNEEVAAKNLYSSPSVCTALLPVVGYHKATQLAKTMRENHCTIFEANQIEIVIDQNKLNHYMEPGMLLQKGYSVNDF